MARRSLLPIAPLPAMLFCIFLAWFELLTYADSNLVMPGMLRVTEEFHANSRYVPWALNACLLGEES